ncbi:metadherin a [Xenentodon cancila]
MAGDWRSFALEKAELLSSRFKELLSSGQGYVRARFGVDLGLKPELYPTWVILCTAVAGLLLLCLSWAAVCGGLLAGKKRRSSAAPGGGEAGEAGEAKPEEPRKKNRKKTTEKKTQSNGQPVNVAQEDVKVAETASKPLSHKKTEKSQDVQAPVQVKRHKKKTKSESKLVQHVLTNDGKEPDDGVWETKVSNREKRQQRRKEKSPEDSVTPRGVEAPITHVETPATTVYTKKNRRNHASSALRKETPVNNGGWSDMSLKIKGQMGSVEGTKWSSMSTAAHYRPRPEPQSWAQEPQAAWSSIDGRIKADLRPVSFSVLGLNATDSLSNSAERQWAKYHNVDDEWSGFNGMAAADTGSDWNAPVEHWGNYEEPPVLVEPAPLQKDPPAPNKVSEDEKDAEDPSGGTATSKKKRKKKKKIEEEVASDAQASSKQ